MKRAIASRVVSLTFHILFSFTYASRLRNGMEWVKDKRRRRWDKASLSVSSRYAHGMTPCPRSLSLSFGARPYGRVSDGMRERLDQDMRKDDERQRSEEAASHLAGRPLSPRSSHVSLSLRSPRSGREP